MPNRTDTNIYDDEMINFYVRVFPNNQLSTVSNPYTKNGTN